MSWSMKNLLGKTNNFRSRRYRDFPNMGGVLLLHTKGHMDMYHYHRKETFYGL